MTTNRMTAYERRAFTPNRPTMTLREARERWVAFRVANGFGISATELLTDPESQPKAGKNAIPTWVLHLAPHTAAGVGNVCPHAKASKCDVPCLNTAGRGGLDPVQRGRVAKTRFLNADPEAFFTILVAEIERHVRRHGKIGIRLNGTSDIRFELVAPWIFECAGVVFYDYTKWGGRNTPRNYHLSYSVSARESDLDIVAITRTIGRAVVVVDTPAPEFGAKPLPLPRRYLGIRAVDGDKTDWRLERGAVVVLLRAKGDAKTDASGFVRPTHV